MVLRSSCSFNIQFLDRNVRICRSTLSFVQYEKYNAVQLVVCRTIMGALIVPSVTVDYLHALHQLLH